jgi:hypothetical protein
MQPNDRKKSPTVDSAISLLAKLPFDYRAILAPFNSMVTPGIIPSCSKTLCALAHIQ